MILFLFSCDFFGPVKPKSFKGNNWCLLFCCDKCNYIKAQSIERKSEAPYELIRFVNEVRRKCGCDTGSKETPDGKPPQNIQYNPQLILPSKNRIQNQSHFSKIQIKDLLNKQLDKKELVPITSIIAKDTIIRNFINNKIKEISKKLPSFIFTGRDTGFKVFESNNNILKFFIVVSDKLAATRKQNMTEDIKENFTYKETLLRNSNDKMNLSTSKNSIIIDNNKKLADTLNKILIFINR